MLFFGQLSPIMLLVTVLNQKGDVSRWNYCSYMKENRFFPSLSPTVYLCYQVFPPTPHSFSSSWCISFASPFYCFCCTRSICCSIFQCLYFASNVSIWRFHNFERKAIPHFNQHFLKINNSITAHQKNFLHCSSLPAWLEWGFWISPLTYTQIGASLNEFHAPRWEKVNPKLIILLIEWWYELKIFLSLLSVPNS